MKGARKLDTPVTSLSKFFSSTGIAEHSKKTNMTCSRKSESFKVSSVPLYIDESANQEPPILNPSSNWLSSESTIIPLIDDGSKSFQSCSSGYFSSSSHSAPPTCSSVFVSDVQQRPNIPHSNSLDNRVPFHLRRSQSCNNTWIAKRNQPAQSWPRLSGILRRSATFPVPSTSEIKSNTIVTNCRSSSFRWAGLSPVCEDTDASIYEDAGLKMQDAINCNSCLMSPSGPAAKRQRITSPVSVALVAKSPLKAVTSNEISLDATMPLDGSTLDETTIEIVNSKEQIDNDRQNEIPFNLLRGHSTPMTNVKTIRTCLFQEKIEHRPRSQLSRCVSVPVFVDADKPSESDHASAPKTLPVIERTGAGLHFIAIETVANLISGQYEEKNVEFLIVDCRFPYEFNGGHIKNAVNLYVHNDLVQEVFVRVPAQNPSCKESPKLLGENLSRRLAIVKPELPLPKFRDYSCTEESEILGEQDSDLLEEDLELQHQHAISRTEQIVSELSNYRNLQSSSQDSGASSWQLYVSSEETFLRTKKFVVIFHCEFSSQRAPHLATFLRRFDRMTNYHRYPFLFFPEIYVMKGGYSEFHKKFPEYCDPSEYITMFDPAFRTEMRFFNRLTKRVSDACQDCLHVSKELATGSAVISPQAITQPEGSSKRPSTPKKEAENDCLFNVFYKENIAPIHSPTLALRAAEDKPISPTITAIPERRRETVLNMSLEVGSSIDSISSIEEDDSSLRLAEAVVRVGRQVVAATLCEKQVFLSTDEHYLEEPGSCNSKPNVLVGSGCSTPHTPVGSCFTRPPLMKLSMQGSPCAETPLFSRRE